MGIIKGCAVKALLKQLTMKDSSFRRSNRESTCRSLSFWLFKFQAGSIFKGRIFRAQKRDANTLPRFGVSFQGERKSGEKAIVSDCKAIVLLAEASLAWAAGLAKRPVDSRGEKRQIRLGVNRNYRCDPRLRNAARRNPL